MNSAIENKTKEEKEEEEDDNNNDNNYNNSKNSRGVATGGIWGIHTIPPKSVQVNFLWDRNDVRTAIEHEY